MPSRADGSAAPGISAQPQSQSVVLSSNAVFTVVASGQTPLLYQWSLNGTNLTDTAHVIGATSSSLTINQVVAGDAGIYRVVVSNSHGSVTSSNVTLTVLFPATIANQPTSQVARLGGTAVFSVTANGTGPLVYQWQKDGTNLLDNGRMNGTAAPGLTISNVQTSDIGNYQLTVSNAYGTATSAKASFLVVPVVAWGDGTYGQTNIPLGATNAVAVAAAEYDNFALDNHGVMTGWGYYFTLPAGGLSNVVSVATGLALKNDGSVLAWGDNSEGQTNVPAGLSNVVAISEGFETCLALRNDGSVVAWGNNLSGQASVPVGLSNVIEIAAGSFLSAALKNDGTVIAWGSGFGGSSLSLSNIVAISAGQVFIQALRNDGTVMVVGDNNFGETNVPAGLTNVVAIASGFLHCLALKNDGTVVAWGDNSLGQTSVPAGLQNVVAIAGGGYESLALADNPITPMPPTIWWQQPDRPGAAGQSVIFMPYVNGSLPMSFQWYFNGTALAGETNKWLDLPSAQTTQTGSYQFVVSNEYGAVTSTVTTLTVFIPIGFTTQPTNQTLLPGRTAVFSVTATGTGPLGYQWLKDGAILTDSGRILGTAGSTLTISNVQFSDIGHYSVIVSNMYETAASSQAGLVVVPVVAWGDNTYGEASIPVAFTNTLTISTEGYTAEYLDLGLKSDGTVAAWGYNYYNEFGDTYFGQTNLPAGLSNVIQVSAGFRNGLALKSDGTVVCLGDSSFGEATPPVGLNNVANVAAGGLYSLALRSNGTVVGWGYDGSGATDVPAGLSNVVALDAGVFHSLAIKTDGTVVGWGLNDYGQAIAPTGLSNVVAVSAGSHHSMALKSDGTVVAWGYDYFGESDVPAGLSNVVAIAAGYYHSLALKSDGTVVAWGENDQSQATPPAGLSNVVAIAAGNIHSLALVRNPATQIPPVIRWQGPTSRSVVAGRSAVFLPFVTGSLPMNYQWYLNGAPLPGQTNRWLTLTSIQTNQAGGYQFVLTNNYGGATSAPVTLSVLVPAYIMAQPSNQVVTVSGNANFMVIANGTGFLNYQWYFNGVPLANGGRVTGSTAANLTIANVQISDGGSYQVVVSNAYGTVMSIPAILGTTYGIPGVVRFVSVNSTNPTAPYTDWGTAATNIQSAINASGASASDTVLVSPGIYRESVNFNGKPVWLVSANGPANTMINPPASSASITFGSGETSNSVVSGFNITNGGISLSFSSATISSNVLLNCGTGINCYFSSPYIFNNVISGGSGNGVYLQGADTAVVQGNLIQKNAGAIGMFAAGSPTIVNNVIQNNQGTAISMVNQSDANIVQNIIAFNTGDGINALVPSGARGPWLINNTIYGNSGNGIYEDGFISTGEIINNIVVGSPALNLSPWYGGNFAITLYNDFYSTNGYVYAGVTNVTGVNGNLSVNPLFLAYPYGNFHLQSGSPCINSGRNNYVVGTGDLDGKPRIKGGTVDLGVYEYQTPASVISYAWLQQYSLPTDGSVDYADLDGTGFNVYQDWIAGLNPTNALSVLKMLSPFRTNNPAGVVVTWQSVTNVTYFLQRSGNLAAPFFSVQSNIIGQTGTTSYTDSSATNSGPYFYRVGVQ